MTTTTLRQLDVDADLSVAVDGLPAASIRARGAEIELDVTRAGAQPFGATVGGTVKMVRLLSRVAPALRASGLRLVVRVDGNDVAVAGHGVPSRKADAWRSAGGVEWRLPALIRAGTAVAFARGSASQGESMSKINLAKTMIGAAAFVSFLLSVYLWFVVDREQGLFVGIWVPSILSLGALVLAGPRPSR